MRASQICIDYAKTASEAIAEMLWPTHCVLCREYGSVLCDSCRAQLSYIDQWRSCPRCGAPFCVNQCTECNSFSLKSLGRDALPYTHCVSAVSFDSNAARIVRTRKDAGERRLAQPMAFAIASAIPPEWVQPSAALVFIPSTRAAQRRRGFCHAQELAQEVAQLLKLRCMPCIEVAETSDQRSLGRVARARNTQGRFRAVGSVPERAILIDDVYTTGSTVMAATDALLAGACARVDVATFARV